MVRAVENCVVTVPKALLVGLLVFGAPNIGVLKTLYASPRISRLIPSLSRVFLSIDISTWRMPSPRMPVKRLLRLIRLLASCWLEVRLKHAVLNHSRMVRWLPESGIWFNGQVTMAFPNPSGGPLCLVNTPINCHPPITEDNTGVELSQCLPWPKG